jgi:hypothetical protein
MQEKKEMLNNSNGNGTEMIRLVQRLQKEDTRNLLTFKRFQWIFIVFIIFYGFVFVLNPFSDFELRYRITGICYVLAFVIFGLVFRKYYREYKSIDYSLPVSAMLKKAAERYSFQYKNTWWVIPPLLLIDAGITIAFFHRIAGFTTWERIGLVQLFYIPIMIMAFLIGVLIWYKRQKPLRDAALQLLDELQD